VRSLILRGVSIAFLSVLCACGGGGGGGGSSTVPPPPSTPTPSPAPTATPPGTATFTLTTDSTSSITGSKRRPRYVSVNTASIAIVVNGAGSATVLNLGDPAHCDASKKCSISLSAPPGNDTFLISAYDAANGQGNLLSRATVQATIAANGTSVISAVLNGVVATMTVALANPMPTLHQPLTDALTVVAKDASGATIVGPGGYLYPITLTNSDTSGHATLTKTTLNGPGDAVALQYDGGYAAGTITASAQGVSQNATASFFPQITTTEYAVPSGHTASWIIPGADGAMWFVSSSSSSPSAIGRITTSGVITEYPVPGWNVWSVCVGPDGAIWAGLQSTQNANIALARRNADGSFTIHPLGALSALGQLIVGADGNFWFSGYGLLNQVTPAGVWTQIHLKDANGNAMVIQSATAGPDQGIWFTTYGGFGRYDISSGATKTYTVQPPNGPPATPGRVVVGPDSRFYFDAFVYLMSSDTAGNMTTVMQAFGGYNITPLTFSQDGGLWLSAGAILAGNPQWLRVLGSSVVPIQGSTAMPGVFPPAAPQSMVTGPDRALWYVRGTVVGRMVP
jgi:streptogramin lyase